MAVDPGLQRTSYVNDVSSPADLMTFCMQLVHHSQWKARRIILCGSKFELPNLVEIIEELNLSTTALDIDVMILDSACYAVDQFVSLPKAYTGSVIRIYTEDVHAGYVRLIQEKYNAELFLNDVHTPCTACSGDIMHGPAVLRDNIKYLSENKYSRSNDSDDDVELGRFKILYHDTVYAVHCPHWPKEATEWITRKRTRSFPSKFVRKRIVRHGCDFAQVSHNRRYNDNDWRFSFSVAERFITENWTLSQRTVYSALWVLNKMIGSVNLCSYYFKTLVFWACEDKPNQFWSYDNLFPTVTELLIYTMKSVKLKFCANYFIPSNNMMDHLIDTDLSNEIDALWRTCQSHQLISKVIETCWRHASVLGGAVFCAKSPAWIKRAFVIYWRLYNEWDNYANLFCTDLARDLQNALYVELSDIYRGLCFQQKCVGCECAVNINIYENIYKHKHINICGKHIYLLKSERHLLLAIDLWKSQKQDVTNNWSEKFAQSVMNKFMSRDTDLLQIGDDATVELNTACKSTADTHNSPNVQDEQKCLLYSPSVDELESTFVNNYWNEMISNSRDVEVTMSCTCTMQKDTYKLVQFFKEWPGHSPTVNISWFIAKAYLANLYFTTQRDVGITIKTCDDIIYVYSQSRCNENFAENAFTVVLSTQWTSIYDKEIQKLLGFYSLCSYLLEPSIRSVYLGVCPVQFALYLKLRIDSTHVTSVNTKCNNSRIDCFEHFNVCHCDRNVNNGHLILRAIMGTIQ